LKIEIKKLNDKAIIPNYQTEESAGFDLHSIDDYNINSGERVLIKTGLSMALPKGYELQIRPRSGLALKYGITVLNTPGTIDSDYRGEIMILLFNTSKDNFKIASGDRIAQGVLKQVTQAVLIEVEELDRTNRGNGGFGSTGK
jgi:dUTP pyrophosphatase